MNPLLMALLASSAKRIKFEDLPREVRAEIEEARKTNEEVEVLLGFDGEMYRCTLPPLSEKKSNSEGFFDYHGNTYQTFGEASNANHKITSDLMSKTNTKYS